MEGLAVEKHPLQPFLPGNARLLMLGSFPPKKERWSMDFFYPNFNNDMWRIFGLIFFNDRNFFVTGDGKHFDREKIMQFCSRKGIALYDTAESVRRLRDNASDKFLEIVRPSDLESLLRAIPECRAVAVTGQKAAETAAGVLECKIPSPGHYSVFRPAQSPAGNQSDADRIYRLWRVPSSSRAYPLSLDRKAETYRLMFASENIL